MIKITNTLSKKKDEFLEPSSPIRMFVCGPTVYDYIHIGNARTFVIFDMIAKYLRFRGYDLKYIQNITDIDDRIIERANKLGIAPRELAEKYEEIFLDDMRGLNVTAVDRYARATDHIPEVIAQVKTLMEKGHAYTIPNDGIYFDLATFPEYGKLSRRTAEMAEDAVTRIDESPDKRNRGDFCLWKFSKPGEPVWSADIGDGRPGWHIEDTAITEKYFGPQYEIHGGGNDLIFPHHEAEIAQQESASGLVPFVRYWLHTGFLVNKDKKMSKSLGNFLSTSEALAEYSPETLRFYFLNAHYRSPLDYSLDNLKQAEAAVARISEFRDKLRLIETNAQKAETDSRLKEIAEKAKEEILADMDDDFNTPKAIAIFFDLMREVNQKIDARKFDIKAMGPLISILNFFDFEVFGVLPPQSANIPTDIREMLIERQNARDQKDFSRADELREQLKNLGYEVDDTPYGPLVKKVE